MAVVRPMGVYLLDFFCSGIQFYLLSSPNLCFISLLIKCLVVSPIRVGNFAFLLHAGGSDFRLYDGSDFALVFSFMYC